MFRRKKKQLVLVRSEGEVVKLDTNVIKGRQGVSVTQIVDTETDRHSAGEGLRASRQVICQDMHTIEQ